MREAAQKNVEYERLGGLNAASDSELSDGSVHLDPARGERRGSDAFKDSPTPQRSLQSQA